MICSLPKRRVHLPLEKKLEIIQRFENGERIAQIARDNGMNESSVRVITKNKDQIKELGQGSSPYAKKICQKQRSYAMQAMEQMLLTWISDCEKNDVNLSALRIKTKAKSLYTKIKADQKAEAEKNNVTLSTAEINETFYGSQGWYERFKNRSGLHNMVLISESANDIDGLTKSFQCDLCGKALSSAGNLRKHFKSIHEDLKDFQCDLCGKSFAFNTDLQKHIKTSHEAAETVKNELTSDPIHTMNYGESSDTAGATPEPFIGNLGQSPLKNTY